jgi:cbb3-type cytochrome oxidase cytochrome c subunit
MPGFPWLSERLLDSEATAGKLRALRAIGVPYSDADISGAAEAVAGKTEMDALISYMQGLKFRGKPVDQDTKQLSSAAQFEAARAAAAAKGQPARGQP